MHIKKILLLIILSYTNLFGSSLIVKENPIIPYNIELVPTNKKVVSLTFDDGPNRNHTKKILKILKKHRINATFFLIAKKSKAEPTIIKEIIKNGHEIGNHSYSHLPYTKLNEKDRLIDIAKSQDIFKHQLGYYPRYFRAPYGKINKTSILALKRFYKHHIGWTIDPKDWENKKENVTHYISDNIQPGAIILLHETSDKTLELLPEIILKLKSEGYAIVTISKLIEEYDTF